MRAGRKVHRLEVLGRRGEAFPGADVSGQEPGPYEKGEDDEDENESEHGWRRTRQWEVWGV